jgi:hypothetical protein
MNGPCGTPVRPRLLYPVRRLSAGPPRRATARLRSGDSLAPPRIRCGTTAAIVMRRTGHATEKGCLNHVGPRRAGRWATGPDHDRNTAAGGRGRVRPCRTTSRRWVAYRKSSAVGRILGTARPLARCTDGPRRSGLMERRGLPPGQALGERSQRRKSAGSERPGPGVPGCRTEVNY